MLKMGLFAIAFAATLPLFVVAAPVTNGVPTPQIEAAIKAQNALWAKAYARGDNEAIARLYTKDGSLLPPGGEKINGSAAIAKYFAGAPSDTLSFSNYEFYGNEQVVSEISDSEIRNQNGELKSRGKQILIFLNQGGTWKLHRDIWNDYAS
ncbi:DUF4440 domain-containing protein [Rouxiella silvae]|uniref:DUF4440 domain-containing protein n=2 Tax=Rouxiella silvae TaxID=1646373 RepID=A0ABX3TUE1_9GAMM|nr:DUF4440 domain-containing protein [Rouxiella silvae]